MILETNVSAEYFPRFSVHLDLHSLTVLFSAPQPIISVYSHRTPAVYNEILFSENCATDRDMADYSDQRRLAISYEIWLCHFSVKMIDSMLHAAGKSRFDLLSRVVDVSSRSILVQRAQECCAIAAKESRVHSAMWKQVLSAVLQPLEKCEEQSNIQ